MKQILISKVSFETPIGSMLAMADSENLYLLSFTDHANKHYDAITKQRKLQITSEITKPIRLVKDEIYQYFMGTLTKFTSPQIMIGTEFQKSVWENTKNIMFGEITYYAALAKTISNTKSYRAVANALGANKFAIIIPCHRVINSNGSIGGYSSGSTRKQWLLDHEKNHKSN